MNEKKILRELYSKIQKLWTYKIIRYAIIIHIFYYILSIILFFTVFYEQNDFRAFYNAGSTFITNINELYSQENLNIHFRYLPLSALLYVPFTIFDFNVGYIVFTLFNLVLTIISSFILYKIIIFIRNEDNTKEKQTQVLYISLFLLCLPHIDNYVLGQINLYILTLILIALYLFLKYDQLKWQIIGGIILGISINIKPMTILLIPFIVVINFNINEKK